MVVKRQREMAVKRLISTRILYTQTISVYIINSLFNSQHNQNLDKANTPNRITTTTN